MYQTVLIVDDDAAVRAWLAHVLDQADFRLLVAESPAAALELLAVEPVDVVLTDDQMPEMMGSDLVGILHTMYPEVVIVMLTGGTTIHNLSKAINQGHVFRLLLKPCSDTDLVATLRDALAQKLLWDRCREALPILHQVSSLLLAGDEPHHHGQRVEPDPPVCRGLRDLAAHLDGAVARQRQALLARRMGTGITV
jgi:adenylate cyclase